MLNRAVIATGRDLARAKQVANALYSPTGTATEAPGHQGRGSANLRLADRIIASSRTIVSPDMENGDATVDDGSPEQEMEPLDPNIAPRQADDEEEDEEEMSLEAAGVEVIAIEVDTGDEEELVEDEPAV